MQTLRKKASPFKYKNDPSRFMGEGMNFKAKLIGILEVNEARGDRMCQEALNDLKMAIRAAGEHKQRIVVNIGIDGLRLKDERNGDSLHHHPVHKISFIAQDTSDARAFGYIYGSPDIGHRFFGLKTEKAASIVVVAMRDLFQVVFELKKKEIELAKQSFSDHQKFRYGNVLPKFSDSIVSTSKNFSSSNKLLRIENERSRYSSMQNADHSHSHDYNASRTDSLSPSLAVTSSHQKSQSLLLLQSPTAPGSVKVDQKQQPLSSNDEAISDLLDLELELNNIRQGIHQMEQMTPCDQYGSVTLHTARSASCSGRASVSESSDFAGSTAILEDPFGDSFTKYYIPPPPQSNRLSTNRSQSEKKPCSNEVISKRSSPAMPITTNSTKHELTALNAFVDRKLACDVPKPSLGLTTTVSLPPKNLHLPNFDVFADLDPLGKGKPYIEKKLYFNENKNGTKITLNHQQQQNSDGFLVASKRTKNNPILDTKSTDSQSKASAVLSTLDDLYKKKIVLPNTQQHLQLSTFTTVETFDDCIDPFLDLKKRPSQICCVEGQKSEQSMTPLLTSSPPVLTKFYDQTAISLPSFRSPTMPKRIIASKNSKTNECSNLSSKSEIPPLPKPNRKVPCAKRTDPLDKLQKQIESKPIQRSSSLKKYCYQTEEQVCTTSQRNVAESSSVSCGRTKNNSDSGDEYLMPVQQQQEEMILNLQKLSELSNKLNMSTNELSNMTLSQLSDLLMKPQSQSNRNDESHELTFQRSQAVSVSDVFHPPTKTTETIDRYSALREIEPFDLSQATTVTSCSTMASETAYFDVKNELVSNYSISESDNECGTGRNEDNEESATATKNSMTLTAGLSLSSFEDANDIVDEQDQQEQKQQQQQQQSDENGREDNIMGRRTPTSDTDWADFENQQFQRDQFTITESQELSRDMTNEDEESSSASTTSVSSGEQTRLCKSHKHTDITKGKIKERHNFQKKERSVQLDDLSEKQPPYQRKLHEYEDKTNLETKIKSFDGGNQRRRQKKQRLLNFRGRWRKHDNEEEDEDNYDDDDDDDDYDDGEVDYEDCDYDYDDNEDEDDNDNDQEPNHKYCSDSKSSRSCHYEMLNDQQLEKICWKKKRISDQTTNMVTTGTSPVMKHFCCCSCSKKEKKNECGMRLYCSKTDERYHTMMSLKRERQYSPQCCDPPDNCKNCGCGFGTDIASSGRRNKSRNRSRSHGACFKDDYHTATAADGSRQYVNSTSSFYCNDKTNLAFGSKLSLHTIASNIQVRDVLSHTENCCAQVLAAKGKEPFQHRLLAKDLTSSSLISAPFVSKAEEPTDILDTDNVICAPSPSHYREKGTASEAKNGFEDDFIPFVSQTHSLSQQSLPVPSETITGNSSISSIAEEGAVPNEELHNYEQSLFEAADSAMHKSESVNIFGDEQDPFDDAFFRQNFMSGFPTTSPEYAAEQASACEALTTNVVITTTSNVSDLEWSKKFKTFED